MRVLIPVLVLTALVFSQTLAQANNLLAGGSVRTELMEPISDASITMAARAWHHGCCTKQPTAQSQMSHTCAIDCSFVVNVDSTYELGAAALLFQQGISRMIAHSEKLDLRPPISR
jgi:hypothetical protein